MANLKARVDKDKCTGCGTCTAVASDVFEMGEDGKAQVVEAYKDKVITDDAVAENAKVASQACPAIAIEIEEE